MMNDYLTDLITAKIEDKIIKRNSPKYNYRKKKPLERQKYSQEELGILHKEFMEEFFKECELITNKLLEI